MPDLSKMSDTSYDRLKRAAELFLPATGALYFTLAQIWGLPYGEQVVGSIAALNTFVGVIVVIARKQYNASESQYDGALVMKNTQDVGIGYLLELDESPETLAGRTEFRVKVERRDN